MTGEESNFFTIFNRVIYPCRFVMFNMMRACIAVKTPEELWFFDKTTIPKTPSEYEWKQQYGVLVNSGSISEKDQTVDDQNDSDCACSEEKEKIALEINTKLVNFL